MKYWCHSPSELLVEAANQQLMLLSISALLAADAGQLVLQLLCLVLQQNTHSHQDEQGLKREGKGDGGHGSIAAVIKQSSLYSSDPDTQSVCCRWRLNKHTTPLAATAGDCALQRTRTHTHLRNAKRPLILIYIKRHLC